MGSEVTVNGKTIHIQGSHSVNVVGGKIYVDGKLLEEDTSGIQKVVIEGPVHNVTSDMTIECKKDISGNVEADIVYCGGNVHGDVQADQITCKDIGGDVQGDIINCRNVKGHVSGDIVNKS